MALTALSPTPTSRLLRIQCRMSVRKSYLSASALSVFLGLESDAFVGDAVGISTSEGGSIVR